MTGRDAVRLDLARPERHPGALTHRPRQHGRRAPAPDPALRERRTAAGASSAVRLADALGVTVCQLAGQPSDRIQLDGTWWAAWQTFNEGREVIATQPVGLTQHGPAVQIEALERSSENERGGYLWPGELRLWDGRVLMGWYAAADGNVLSKGTLFFVLHAHGEYAEGRWVGLSYDGPIVTGYAALARTVDDVQTVIQRLVEAGRSLP